MNSLSNAKILDRSKLKAFAEDKSNAIEKIKFLLEWVENFVGKGENASFQHFLLFPKCFQKSLFLGVVKSRDFGRVHHCFCGKLCQASAAQWVMYQTWEQGIAGLIPGSGNILSEDW